MPPKGKELASTPVAHKFRPLTALLTSAHQGGWIEAPAEEGYIVRERWVRLRQVGRG